MATLFQKLPDIWFRCQMPAFTVGKPSSNTAVSDRPYEEVEIEIKNGIHGATSLFSTMRYLKPSRGQAVREKVNAMFD